MRNWAPWILVGGGIAVGYYFYRKMKSSIRPFPQVKIPDYSYDTGIVPPNMRCAPGYYWAPMTRMVGETRGQCYKAIQIDGGDITYQSDPGEYFKRTGQLA